MTIDDKLVAALLEELGQEGYEIVARSQYHVQIPCVKKNIKGFHNLWFTKDGMKFQASGQRTWMFVYSNTIRDELRKYAVVQTDLDMLSAVSFIRKAPIKEGIFVDAGFKDGKAKVAIIRIQSNGDTDVHIRNFECANAFEAEDMGILMAFAMFPGDETVYNDCETAVAKNQPRARWLNRKQNKEADTLGNMRKTPKG